MNAFELLDKTIESARRAGVEIIYDNFEGQGGGGCMVNGRRRIYLDLTQSSGEQLESILASLEDFRNSSRSETSG